MREQIAAGVTVIRLPVVTHANTLSKVGFLEDPREPGTVIPWEQALEIGHSHLDSSGKLRHEIWEIVGCLDVLECNHLALMDSVQGWNEWLVGSGLPEGP